MKLNLNRNNINSYFNDYSIGFFVKRNLPKLKGEVLDIGCARMSYKSMILSTPGVKKYTGLDLDEGKFSYSVKADLYWDGIRIPLPDNSIDSALLLEVMEHCPDPRIVVSEALRVLKPGGVILFSTPFLYQLHGVPFDYHRPTPMNLELLFRSAGFGAVHIESSGGWDASLGQIIGIWINHRPMPILIRKVLQVIFVPIFKLLLRMDVAHITVNNWKDSQLSPGYLGIAYK